MKSSAVNFENQRRLKSMTVFCGIENLEDLRLVGFGVLLDLLAGQRRTGHGAAGGIANHAGEIADQKNGRVAEILKVLELAQHDGVAEVKIGSGRVHAELHAQRLAGGAGLLELGAQVALANDFRAAFLDVGELFVNRCEVWHASDALLQIVSIAQIADSLTAVPRLRTFPPAQY